jgi:plasmid stabilization system protein ParE
MRVQYHPQATDELTAAIDYYNKLGHGLGDELKVAVSEAIARILENPTRFRMTGGGMRRYLVAGFPYSVLYIVKNDLVRIMVIRHHRRNPRIGMRRT